MMEGRGRLGLTLEAGANVLVPQQMSRQEFQSNRAIELGVFG